jgi:perosamine synthetase
MNYMRDHGIGCSNYFWPIHLQPYFLQAGHYKGEFPVAEAVSASTIALPLFNRLTELEIERVAQILRRAFTKLV